MDLIIALFAYFVGVTSGVLITSIVTAGGIKTPPRNPDLDLRIHPHIPSERPW